MNNPFMNSSENSSDDLLLDFIPAGFHGVGKEQKMVYRVAIGNVKRPMIKYSNANGKNGLVLKKQLVFIENGQVVHL